MYKLTALLFIIGAASALPQFGRPPKPQPFRTSPPAPGVQGPVSLIVKQAQDINPDGSYQFNYETDTGIAAQENGYLKNIGQADEAQVVQGTFSYTSPEGIPITITYVSDENGFQAQGDSIPQAPPIPEAIARSIAYNAAHPEEDQPQQFDSRSTQNKRRF